MSIIFVESTFPFTVAFYINYTFVEQNNRSVRLMFHLIKLALASSSKEKSSSHFLGSVIRIAVVVAIAVVYQTFF